MQPTEFRAQPGTLYVVATPIGNLRDITLRALDIFKSVDLVAAEDTRTSAGLFAAHGIPVKFFAYHEHNEQGASQTLVEKLRAGQSVALISDAGTPGISDPGAVLVARAREAGIAIVPLPGPSAVATLLSAAGLEEGRWLFHGFLPHKAGARRKELEGLKALPFALLFYESPHRIRESLADMAAVLGGERRLFIGRELTKRFEAFHACPLGEAPAWLDADPNNGRGEFALVVAGAAADAEAEQQAARHVLEVLLTELSPSQAARLAARLTGAKKNALYDLALELNSDQVTK